MKRTEINSAVKYAIDFLDTQNFKLPPFAYWSAKQWKHKDKNCSEIVDTMLGWDVTDFGYQDFSSYGLTCFTLRNGVPNSPQYNRPYAEKILISREGQITPYHFHWYKMEDIINRGGGNLMVQLYQSTKEECLDEESCVRISVDAVKLQAEAGTILRLKPGQSICITQGIYHRFWGEKGYGDVLLGEVSMTNDDRCDNRFLESSDRYTKAVEDAEPEFLLCNEYQ